jgi:hypothetical protein
LMPVGEEPIAALCGALIVEQLAQGIFTDGYFGSFTFNQHPGFVVAVVDNDIEALGHAADGDLFFDREESGGVVKLREQYLYDVLTYMLFGREDEPSLADGVEDLCFAFGGAELEGDIGDV